MILAARKPNISCENSIKGKLIAVLGLINKNICLQLKKSTSNHCNNNKTQSTPTITLAFFQIKQIALTRDITTFSKKNIDPPTIYKTCQLSSESR